MKEQILILRLKGKTYKEIAQELGCSKSTVAYYCNDTTKAKVKEAGQRNPNIGLIKNLSTFKAQTTRFSRSKDDKCTPNFTYKDVIAKFGMQTKCYLTGKPIDLSKDDYHFDHIIPRSKGGDNSLENLGITTPEANRSKTDLTITEYISLCKTVLEYNGYLLK